MARGISLRNTDLQDIIQNILVRLRRIERPSSIHIGGIGSGYLISIDPATGNLVATSDSGTQSVIATP